MKTHDCTAGFKIGSSLLCSRFALSTLALTVALAAQLTKAGTMSLDVVQVGYTIKLTENSSTSLSLTYNGTSTFSVSNPSPDMWTVMVTSGSVSFSNFTSDWTEPENPLEVNEVSHNALVG